MMGPDRRVGLPSSSGGIARLAARLVRKRGGWLGCRQVRRLHLAFAGWGRRGPGGSGERRGLLPARLLGGCRGRVGLGLSASSQWPVISRQWPAIRAALGWTDEDGCPHTIQHLRQSISRVLRAFGFVFGAFYLFDLYFCDAVTFHLFYRVAVTFVFEGFAQIWDALQAGQHESGQGFESGVAGQEQAVLGFEVADVDCSLEYKD